MSLHAYYLFVHFREKTSPDGEQVYFAVSRDGFHWEALNGGNPILWAYYGDFGVRDMTIFRDKNTGICHIFATDLSLSYGMRGKYNHSWDNIRKYGSKFLAHWQSEDLIHWGEEELVQVADERFGCVWAPDVIYDTETKEYVLHWSSCFMGKPHMGIYCCRTRDFKVFSSPELLYEMKEGSIIDSAMYEENGKYYLFVKGEENPRRVMLLEGNHVHGPFLRNNRLDEAMLQIEEGKYEAPAAVQLEDGRWCLFLDYYGVAGAGQGYVPFIAPSLKSGEFTRSDSDFSFPYGFKHGTILQISEDEYTQMKMHEWEQVPDGRWS
ncbi:MAG: glycoside hydrolase family 43 protein [Blautia sp.]|nr:glycoside hydrolase family 43 protein [Blautia sp.]